MKKKYSLLKVLAVLLFLVVVATYFIESRNGEIEYLAIVDVFFNFVQSFYYFFDTALFILVVGGFYGLLNRIPAYKMVVQGIANKMNKKSKLFVIVVTVAFALLSSLTGLNLLLLIFVPFVISIILLLGYDKLVALSATVGGILVGFIGGIFVTFKDASSQYATSYTTFEKMVGLKSHWSLATTLPKCLLLVIGIVLLVIYIISYIKNTDSKENKLSLVKTDPLLVEIKDKSALKGKSKDSYNVKVWPLILVVSIMVIFLILGYMPWSDLFGVDCFTKFHTWLTGISIGKYQIFTNLISGNITSFGTWSDLGNYMMAIFSLCFFGWILSLIYRVRFDDAMDGFVYGVKKMLIPTMTVMLAYCVLVCSYNNGFIDTIITTAGKSFGDNVVVHSLITMLGSVLNVDLYYTSAGIFTPIISSLTDKANLSVYAVMFQSFYGLIQFVGPTSLLLVVGLSYLEVPYKSWLKYIWRFIVELLIAIFVLLMIVSLL